MHAQERFNAEAQERYQRALAEREREERRRQRHAKREKEKAVAASIARNGEHELAMDRYVATNFRVFNIIIDSEHRNQSIYPNSNDYVVKLQDNLLNVVAIRVLKTEFYQDANSVGFMVFNDVQIPLQLYNVQHAYLYLNGMINTAIANETNIALFGRIGPGTEMYPAVSADPFKDPYIYVMRPVEPRMRRFHVKLYTANGELYPVNKARIVITLAVYCLL
jgi:hypothetical protein